MLIGKDSIQILNELGKYQNRQIKINGNIY